MTEENPTITQLAAGQLPPRPKAKNSMLQHPTIEELMAQATATAATADIQRELDLANARRDAYSAVASAIVRRGGDPRNWMPADAAAAHEIAEKLIKLGHKAENENDLD